MMWARHKTLIAVAAAVLLAGLAAGSFLALRHDGRARGTAARSPSPSPSAAAQLRSPFTGEPVPVTVRWSNGGGDPDVPDKAQDVRGMALKIRSATGDVDLLRGLESIHGHLGLELRAASSARLRVGDPVVLVD